MAQNVSTPRNVTFQFDLDAQTPTRQQRHPAAYSKAPASTKEMYIKNAKPLRPSLKAPSKPAASKYSPSRIEQPPVIKEPSPTIEEMSDQASNWSGEEGWRKYGMMYRARLVLTDEEKGGSAFVLSKTCGIDRYYRVADRVLDQFLHTNIRESKELNESYLVCHRLVKFLSVALPNHPEYFSSDPELVQLRSDSQAQLVDLLQYQEELSLLIDEMQYNIFVLQDKYILQDLEAEEKTQTPERPSGPSNNATSPNEKNKERQRQNPQGQNDQFEKTVAAVIARQEESEKIVQPSHDPSRRPKGGAATLSSSQTNPTSDDESWNVSPGGLDHFELLAEPPSPKAHAKAFVGRSEPKTKSRIPKLKQPPATLSRSARAKASAIYSPPRSTLPFSTNDPWPDEVATDPWNKEKRKSEEAHNDGKTLIERRLLEAQEQMRSEQFNRDFGEGHLVNVDASSNKRLLRHFKGCVRFFFD